MASFSKKYQGGKDDEEDSNDFFDDDFTDSASQSQTSQQKSKPTVVKQVSSLYGAGAAKSSGFGAPSLVKDKGKDVKLDVDDIIKRLLSDSVRNVGM